MWALVLYVLALVGLVQAGRSTEPVILSALLPNSSSGALSAREAKAAANAAYEAEDQRKFGELRRWLVGNGGYLAEKVQMKTMLEYGGHGLVVAGTEADGHTGPDQSVAASRRDIMPNETYICVPYRLALSLSTLNMSGLCPECFSFWPHRRNIWDPDRIGWDSPDVDTTSLIVGMFLALQRWHLDTYWPVQNGSSAWQSPAAQTATPHSTAVPPYSRTFWQPLVKMLPDGCVNAANFALYPSVLDGLWGSMSHRLLADVSDAVLRAWDHVQNMNLKVRLTLRQFVWYVLSLANPFLFLQRIKFTALHVCVVIRGVCSYRSHHEAVTRSFESAMVPIDDMTNFDSRSWSGDTLDGGFTFAAFARESDSAMIGGVLQPSASTSAAASTSASAASTSAAVKEAGKDKQALMVEEEDAEEDDDEEEEEEAGDKKEPPSASAPTSALSSGAAGSMTVVLPAGYTLDRNGVLIDVTKVGLEVPASAAAAAAAAASRSLPETTPQVVGGALQADAAPTQVLTPAAAAVATAAAAAAAATAKPKAASEASAPASASAAAATAVSASAVLTVSEEAVSATSMTSNATAASASASASSAAASSGAGECTHASVECLAPALSAAWSEAERRSAAAAHSEGGSSGNGSNTYGVSVRVPIWWRLPLSTDADATTTTTTASASAPAQQQPQQPLFQVKGGGTVFPSDLPAGASAPLAFYPIHALFSPADEGLKFAMQLIIHDDVEGVVSEGRKLKMKDSRLIAASASASASASATEQQKAKEEEEEDEDEEEDEEDVVVVVARRPHAAAPDVVGSLPALHPVSVLTRSLEVAKQQLKKQRSAESGAGAEPLVATLAESIQALRLVPGLNSSSSASAAAEEAKKKAQSEAEAKSAAAAAAQEEDDEDEEDEDEDEDEEDAKTEGAAAPKAKGNGEKQEEEEEDEEDEEDEEEGGGLAVARGAAPITRRDLALGSARRTEYSTRVWHGAWCITSKVRFRAGEQIVCNYWWHRNVDFLAWVGFVMPNNTVQHGQRQRQGAAGRSDEMKSL
jgi:hypothetical protein